MLAARTAPLETARAGTGMDDREEVTVSGGILMRRSISLPPEAPSAREARRFVSHLLEEAGRREWREVAELAVSEVVTNAILHAHTSLTLTAMIEMDRVRVEVSDRNVSLPAARLYGRGATTGRGLALVAAITSAHGVTSLGPAGKTVWFTLGDTPEPGAENDPLTAWDDEGGEGDFPRAAGRPVTLLGLPTRLWMAAREHHDALLRELALSQAGADRPADLAQADRARSTISEALDRAVAGAPHSSSLPDVPPVVDLLLTVPAATGQAFAVLQDVLDDAERRAAQDELLIRPGLPEIIAVRDWACDQVISQCAGGGAARWPGTDSDRFTTARDAGPARALDWDPTRVRDSTTGAIAADDANRILAVSRPLADALGWAVEELVGRRVVALVPHRLREAHIAGFTRHLATGESRVIGVELELPVLHRNGHELACRFLIEASPTASGRTVYLAWITPLTL